MIRHRLGWPPPEHPPPLGYRRVMGRYRDQCLARIGRYRHVRNVTALWSCVLLRLRTDVSEGTLFGRVEGMRSSTVSVLTCFYNPSSTLRKDL